MPATTAPEPELAASAAGWTALAERAGAPPFLWPDWIRAWWRAFGAGRLVVARLEREGRIEAILPLAARFGRLLPPTNDHTPLFGPLAESGAASYALVEDVLAGRPRQLAVSRLDPERPGFAGVRDAATAAGYRVLTSVQWRSPVLELRDGHDAYLATRRRGLLADLRRRRRRLEEIGRVALGVEEDGAALAALDAAWALEAQGWKADRGTAVAARERTRRFYDEVTLWAAGQGWLRLLSIRAEGRLVAFLLGFQHRGVLWLLKGSYDPAFARFSPGSLLLQEAVRHGFAAGLDRIEFGGAEEPYKLAWTDRTREVAMLRCFAPTAAGRAERLAFAHGRPLAQRAGLTPLVARVRGGRR